MDETRIVELQTLKSQKTYKYQNPNPYMKTVRIILKGRVQGVWCRATIHKMADEMNIKGIVRNLDNGNVEIIAQSNEENLNNFIEKLNIKPHGCILINVEKMFVDYITNAEIYEDFAIVK